MYVLGLSEYIEPHSHKKQITSVPILNNVQCFSVYCLGAVYPFSSELVKHLVGVEFPVVG